MMTLTHLGDLSLLLPVAALMLLWLLASAAFRAAAWWTLALCLCAGGIGLMKVYFAGCLEIDSSVRSPSGHAAMSALVYGAVALVAGLEGSVFRQALLGPAAALLVAGIAASRVAIDVHSVPEVLIGLAVGGGSLLLFAAGYQRNRPATIRLWALIWPVLALVVLLHGIEYSPEGALRALGPISVARYRRCVFDDGCRRRTSGRGAGRVRLWPERRQPVARPIGRRVDGHRRPGPLRSDSPTRDPASGRSERRRDIRINDLLRRTIQHWLKFHRRRPRQGACGGWR